MTATTNQTPTREPTAEQFSALQFMFEYFNLVLFGGQLPLPLLNLSRGPAKTVAFFAPSRWHRSANEVIDEISLSPRYIASGTARDNAQSLVHEMVHLWQARFGTPARKGYHNIEWSTKMVAIGLQPLDGKTGLPSMSGPSMSDTIIPGGPFEQAFAQIPPNAVMPWACIEADIAAILGPELGPAGPTQPQPTAPPAAPSRNKMKFTCPACRANAWGKPGLQVLCDDGHAPERMTPAK